MVKSVAVEQSVTLEEMTDHELLCAHEAYGVMVAEARTMQDRVEREISHRLEERGATAIPDALYDCKLVTGSPTIDYAVLASLRELLPPDVVAKGYTPSYQEVVTVPEKWNMTTVNAWAKFGEQIADIIARSKTPGKARLQVIPRKK